MEIQVRDVSGKIAVEIVHRLHSYSEVENSPVARSLQSGRVGVLFYLSQCLTPLLSRCLSTTISATALPFKAGSFDFVLFLEATYYVREFSRALDEIGRVLAPDSVLLFVNANPLRLIPRTLRGRARIKRMIFGKLVTLPRELPEDFASLEPLQTVGDAPVLGHKVIYVIGRREIAGGIPAHSAPGQRRHA